MLEEDPPTRGPQLSSELFAEHLFQKSHGLDFGLLFGRRSEHEVARLDIGRPRAPRDGGAQDAGAKILRGGPPRLLAVVVGPATELLGGEGLEEVVWVKCAEQPAEAERQRLNRREPALER